MGSHYDTLGVAPNADAATLRAAYLAKARAHHPDRNVDAPPAARARAARTMREVNAAWAVLSDPDARRRYDASVAPQPARPAASTRAAQPPSGPAARRPPEPAPPRDREGDVRDDPVGCALRVLPTAAVLLLLLGIFVFTAFAASGGDGAPRTTVAPGDLAAGMCVRAERVLTVVDCRDLHDAVVAGIVGVGVGCPAGTGVYTLDAQRVACLRPAP